MSEEIIKVLDDLAERFGVAIDWTSKNVTPYLQELFDKFIDWEIWTSVFSGAVSIIIVIIAAYFARKLWKWLYSDGEADGNVIAWATFGAISLSIIAIVGMVTVACEAFDIIACVTFPEKALFDYVNHYLEWHS